MKPLPAGFPPAQTGSTFSYILLVIYKILDGKDSGQGHQYQEVVDRPVVELLPRLGRVSPAGRHLDDKRSRVLLDSSSNKTLTWCFLG